MTWKSEIRNGPDPTEAQYFDSVWAEYQEWLEGVMLEPWVLALEGLVRWTELWVGTEEELVGELKLRAGRETGESEDFPSTLEQLSLYVAIAEDGFFERDLGLLDYRELTEEDRDDFDVRGWGPDAPVLVCRGHAPYRPNYWAALITLLRYWHPVPVAVLALTASPAFKKERRRSYTTKNFAKALWKHYPTMLNVPMLFLDNTRPEGFKGIDPSMPQGSHYVKDPHGTDDHRAFRSEMKKWAPILGEVGIGLTWERRASPPGLPAIHGKGLRQKTWWTIEAPRWKKPDWQRMLYTRGTLTS